MKLHGCHDHEPFEVAYLVQDGWTHEQTRRMVSVEFRQHHDCQYTLSELGRDDARCQGCKWRK